MNSDIQSLCIKCGQRRHYDSQGACTACSNIISSTTHPRASRQNSSSIQTQKKSLLSIDPDDLDTIVVGMYIAACIAFLLGVFLPFVTILKQVSILGLSVFSEKNTVSMISGIWSLMKEGQWLLFFVLLLFSIVFPVLKLAILFPICCDRGDELKVKKHLKFLSITGKWSMLDVVVIGILVVTLKLGDMVEVKIHSGIYFFTASVLLTMIISTVAGMTHCKSERLHRS